MYLGVTDVGAVEDIEDEEEDEDGHHSHIAVEKACQR